MMVSRNNLLAILVLFVAALAADFLGYMPAQLVPVDGSAYDFTVLDADGAPYDLARRKGHPTLFMNVASQCGFTSSGYEAATVLYDKYKDRGFSVLAFPCNQFGAQEPDAAPAVRDFAAKHFAASFPIMAKVAVNEVTATKEAKSAMSHSSKGPTAAGGAADSSSEDMDPVVVSPLWAYLQRAAPGIFGSERIKWNFTSFLVDGDGQVVRRYGPGTTAATIENHLLPLLAETAGGNPYTEAAAAAKKSVESVDA
jgi:glutathione peroxidase